MMEGSSEDNNCLPPELWMPQIDPQFSGSIETPTLGVTRSMNTSAHLDLSRKQTPVYDSYGVPGMNYKQNNIEAMTTSAMQPYTSASSRSAWEFVAQNFHSSPQDFTSQSLSLHTTHPAPRLSQPTSNFTAHNVSQPGSTFAAPNHSPKQSNYAHPGASKPVEDFAPLNLPQPVRNMTSQSASQLSVTDRSVWAHLYSLDPSMTSYNANTTVDPSPSYSQQKSFPYSQAHAHGSGTFPQPAVTGRSAQPEKPPLINSRDLMASSYMNTNPLLPDNAPISSFANAPVSSFAPSLYSDDVLGTTSTSKPCHTTDYGEQLEGYSPVSPPAGDSSSPFLPPASGQDAEPTLKNGDFSNSSHRGLNLSSVCSSTSSGGQIVNSDSISMSVPLDMPLDMTKTWPLTDAVTAPSVTPGSNIQQTSSVAASLEASIPSHDLSKQSLSENQLPEMSLASQFGNFSQKAPKKSNFYGRDASYLSLQESLPQIPETDKLSVGNDPTNSLGLTLNASTTQIDSSFSMPSISQSQSTISSADSFISNFDSVESSFADSFIDATTAQCTDSEINTQNATEEIIDPPESMNEDCDNIVGDEKLQLEKTLLQSQVKAVREQRHSVVSPREGLEAVEQSGGQVEGGNDMSGSVTVPVEDAEMNPENPIARPGNAGTGRGRAPRGRRKRGAGAQRRQGKRGGNVNAAVVVPVNSDPQTLSGLSDSFHHPENLDADTKSLIEGTVSAIGSQHVVPIPKPKRGRGRKRKTKATEESNVDSDTSLPRRSSNRRSKDNAMRLIELQAESIYNNPVKPATEEPPPPARTRRKAAKVAIENSFDESKYEEGYLAQGKDSSSDEMSDGKDVDYAVDDEDVEALEKDEMLDISLDQKKAAGESQKKIPIAEKKVGGLKISIKLGSDSSAEIVSGIDKSPPRKKRKTVKRKVGRPKFKSKAIIPDDDLEEEDGDNDKSMDLDSSKEEKEITEVNPDKKASDADIKMEPQEKTDIVHKHNSLMDKYFSSANTASLSRQTLKPGPGKKESKSKQDSSTKSKSVKSNKSGGNAKDSSAKTTPPNPATGEKDKQTDGDSSSTTDKGAAKFVCGYCPKRYHDKHALLSHMETHMAEMETKDEKKPAGTASKEQKKPGSTPAGKKSEAGSGKSVGPGTGKKGEGAEEPEYNCGECGKNFSSKQNLLDHVRTHTAEKPFECNLCHKCFKERNQLSAHRKVHIQEGLIRCPVCSKGFVNNVDLTAHLESHPKRSKSGQGQSLSKNISPESSKKSGKVTHVSSDKEAVTAKPKSFASALEPHSEKSKDHSTIVLRRNDGSSTVPKDEATKSVKAAKSTTSIPKAFKEEHSKKQLPVIKIQDNKKETKSVDLKLKSSIVSENKPASEKMKEEKTDSSGKVKEEKTDTSEKVKEEKTEKIKEEKADSNPGECKCKECPECVTRFLQSFE